MVRASSSCLRQLPGGGARWEAERGILASGLPLPLNLADHPSVAHTSFLSEVRRRARLAALELPALADSGGPRQG